MSTLCRSCHGARSSAAAGALLVPAASTSVGSRGMCASSAADQEAEGRAEGAERPLHNHIEGVHKQQQVGRAEAEVAQARAVVEQSAEKVELPTRESNARAVGW